MPVIPQIQIISDAVEKIKQEMGEDHNSSNGEVSEVTVRKELAKRASIAINGDTLNIFPTDIARLSSKLQEIEVTTVEPFGGSPGLYAYALVLSAIIIALLAVFTSIHTQPKYYK
ncbi:hypothetical protein NECAME_09401, partial [Necator americanus]